ncbi:Lrp/AsnC family transcriptional regulator, partial [Methanosalsum natronophilum]
MTIEESAFHVIKKKKDGIYQNELWKELEIDSRKCSRIISKLLEEGLVTRESAVSNGSRTYLIKANTQTQPSY